jgi:hypothetical protein
MTSRTIVEPGGVLLLGVGVPAEDLARLSAAAHASAQSLTVLISADQQADTFLADEIWVIDRLGPRGFLALIRRISWRHFEFVLDATDGRLWWLKYLIWPRPPYHSVSSDTHLAVDLHKY